MVENTLVYACPFCGSGVEVVHDVVGETINCPKCGQPFRVAAPEAPQVAPPPAGQPDADVVKTPANDERELRVAHPVMFRQHPLQYLLSVALIVGGVAAASAPRLIGVPGQMEVFARLLGGSAAVVGAGYLLVWWIQILCTTLTVTNKRTILRHGIISRSTTEVRHGDVRNLQVHQNIFQRMLYIGDVAISSAGQDDLEIQIRGISDPAGLAELVRSLQ